MAKKKDFQKDFNVFLDQAKVKFKKFGEELNILAKKSEKEIVKASKTGKIQLDIMGLTMQKEKLYYDIGKKITSLKTKKDLKISELDPFWAKMRKIEKDARKKKRELSAFKKKAK